MIQKLDLAGSEARFDGEIRRHHHARCISCGKVDDLFDLPSEVVHEGFRHLESYDIRGYRLEFYGLCPRCRGRQSGEEEIN
jgi:Fe2+ or Zn2+ uptake regulation protein